MRQHIRRIVLVAVSFALAGAAHSVSVSAQVELEVARVSVDAGGPLYAGLDVRDVDLDGDGVLELIASGFDQVVVYALSGPDRFEVRQVVATTAGSGDVFARDLNADGFPDVLAIRDDDVHVSLNDGTGTLVPAHAPSTGAPFNGAGSVGDFDGDGVPDVAVLRPFDDEVVVLLGDGTGDFGSPQVSELGAFGRAVAAADFDEDGFRDLVVASEAGLTLHRGDGTGLFEAPTTIDASSQAFDVLTRDFDRDFHADIAAAPVNGPLRVSLGRGDGTFQATAVAAPVATENIASDDVDGDGDADILWEGADDESFVFENDGAGGFSGSAPRRVECAAWPVAIADFTADGVVDWAGGPFLYLLEGAPSGEFPSARRHPYADTHGPTHTVLVDLDADGHVDVVRASASCCSGGAGVDWLRADGSGGYEAAAGLFSHPSRTIVGIAAGDFDGDGRLDVAAAADGLVHVLLADGSGGFLPAITSPFPATALGPIRPIDVDLDGSDDLVSPLDDDVLSLAIVPAIGGGQFGTANLVDGGANPISLETADVDGDGLIDVVLGKASGDSAFVLRGDGAGGLSVANSIDVGEGANVVRVFDADGDGHPDVALGSTSVCELGAWLARGRGDFSFEPPVKIFDAAGAEDLAAADFDGDGQAEIAVLSAVRIAVLSRSSNATSSFSETDSFARCDVNRPGVLFVEPRLIAHDADEDGVPDLMLDGGFTIRNRTLDPIRARRGSVNAGAGPIANVLFCNDSPGVGPERELHVSPSTPFRVALRGTPFDPDGPVRFALYAWLGHVPIESTVRALPFELGVAALPMPLVAGAPQPKYVWSQLGHGPLLGEPDFPSSPAPSTILNRASGIGRVATFTLQGLMLDPASRNGIASVTNAVVVVSE